MNMNVAARLWEQLTLCCIGLARFFDTKENKYVSDVKAAMARLIEIDNEGYATLGEEYYCYALGVATPTKPTRSNVPFFVEQVTRAFELEVAEIKRLEKQGLTDYVVCGGFNERHSMKKEINFSSSHAFPDGMCRLAGSARGKAWSVIKAHGWFSYEVAVKPNEENTIIISAKGWDSDKVELSVTVGGEKNVFRTVSDKKTDFVIKYNEASGSDKVTVRIDRITENMPVVYTIVVK